MVVDLLKKVSFIKKVYYWIIQKLSKYHPKLASEILYYISQGKKLDLNNPKNFNEKIMWLKLNTYYNNPLVTTCADKVQMRNYVAERGCTSILPKLYGIWTSPNDINWDDLPEKFVLKCNHGCGYNIICKNKNQLDEDTVKKQLKTWLKDDYYKLYAETVYQFIPKKILCEEYIETNTNSLPVDYKVYCFNGTPKSILVCEDRDKEKVRLTWFDLDWNIMDVASEKTSSQIKRPECLDEIIKFSKILSEPFPYIRVDFYNSFGKPFLGEFTFTPYAGLAKYYNENGLEVFGEMLRLPL